MIVSKEYLEKLLETTPSSVYVLVFCVAFVSIVISLIARGFKNGIRVSSLILMILYATIVLCTTVLFRNGPIDCKILVVPFGSYVTIDEGNSRLLEENLMNIAVFVPFGIFLTAGIERLKWWHAAIAGGCLSVVIEFMQFYFKRGSCEVDDIIHNTFGCVIGYYIVRIVVSIYYKLRPKHNASSAETNELNVFEIQQSKQAKEFVLKNGSLEFEVFADILKTAKDIPYIGSLFKLGKVAVNLMDYWFIRKLQLFLEQSETLEEERKDGFLKSLSSGDYKKISKYLTQLLYSSEEEGKAILMGKIYRSRLLGEIDNDMMLRLCSVVNKAFLPDLEHLHEYTAENGDDSYVTDNLTALGLLQDKGVVYEQEHEGWAESGFGSTKHQLNAIGGELLRIMDN